jgi:glycosyltransferase involved in cell wall biosynthesis
MDSGGIRTICNTSKVFDRRKPVVTIITVVRNGEKTLEKTILSIINQTYNNIEYIIIDGSSSDGTLDIIKKYEDKIDYWISEKDEGIYYAMNKGIALAVGEWINFMNSGDCFYNNEVIDKIFGLGKEYRCLIYGNTICKTRRCSVLQYPVLCDIKKYMPFCHQSCFIRSEIMKQYKFDTSYKIVSDYNLVYKLFHDGLLFEYIDTIVSVYEAETGLSTNCHVEVFKEVKRIHEKNLYSFWNMVMLIVVKSRHFLKQRLPKDIVSFIGSRNLIRRAKKSRVHHLIDMTRAGYPLSREK